MAGKGSNRRKEDFRRVQDNWDEIDWGYTKGEYCFECGVKLSKENMEKNPENYIFHEVGEISHKNGCNFN